jgi:hypothetical protein
LNDLLYLGQISVQRSLQMQNKDVKDVHPLCQGCDDNPASNIKTGINDD